MRSLSGASASLLFARVLSAPVPVATPYRVRIASWEFINGGCQPSAWASELFTPKPAEISHYFDSGQQLMLRTLSGNATVTATFIACYPPLGPHIKLMQCDIETNCQTNCRFGDWERVGLLRALLLSSRAITSCTGGCDLAERVRCRPD